MITIIRFLNTSCLSDWEAVNNHMWPDKPIRVG